MNSHTPLSASGTRSSPSAIINRVFSQACDSFIPHLWAVDGLLDTSRSFINTVITTIWRRFAAVLTRMSWAASAESPPSLRFHWLLYCAAPNSAFWLAVADVDHRDGERNSITSSIAVNGQNQSCCWNERMFVYFVLLIVLLFTSRPAAGRTLSGVFRSDAARENNGQYIARFLYRGEFLLLISVSICMCVSI